MNLAVPLVNELIKSDLVGTTCVLTRTNEEALQITGLLLKNRLPAQLIQSNDGFNLYNLYEIRFFLAQLDLPVGVYVINEEVWKEAKCNLNQQFGGSTNLSVCHNLIKNFESLYPKVKYKSDLEVYIQESTLADFVRADSETVIVSTMHKAKGKEYDNLFLMLDNYNAQSDEAKRLLYVAMTRAKRNLYIHLNTNILDDISTENLERFEDKNNYLPPTELAIQLSFKDIWLDYCGRRQNLIVQLRSGDTLILDDNDCLNQDRQSVLKFSRSFTDKISALKNLNYELSSAKVHFMVYWKKEDADNEILIILPEVHFKRRD